MTSITLRLRKLVLALALAAGAAGALAGPALAADWHHGPRDWHGRPWRPPVAYIAPAPVYPVVVPEYGYPVVTPPPVAYVAPAPVATLNFTLPLAIR